MIKLRKQFKKMQKNLKLYQMKNKETLSLRKNKIKNNL